MIALTGECNNGNEQILALRVAVFVCLRIGPEIFNGLERRPVTKVRHSDAETDSSKAESYWDLEPSNVSRWCFF